MPSFRELYQSLGPRLFWRSMLHGMTLGLLPRRFDISGEVQDRASGILAREYLVDREPTNGPA